MSQRDLDEGAEVELDTGIPLSDAELDEVCFPGGPVPSDAEWRTPRISIAEFRTLQSASTPPDPAWLEKMQKAADDNGFRVVEAYLQARWDWKDAAYKALCEGLDRLMAALKEMEERTSELTWKNGVAERERADAETRLAAGLEELNAWKVACGGWESAWKESEGEYEANRQRIRHLEALLKENAEYSMDLLGLIDQRHKPFWARLRDWWSR
jgi:hypothetical protein